jgi:hypothetical protein
MATAPGQAGGRLADAFSHRIPVQSGSAAGKQQNRPKFWMRNLRGIENQEV